MDKSYQRLFAIAALLLPPILLLIFVKVFGVNVAYADEWTLVPMIEKLKAGTLTFGELYRGHNEHRILIPRIVMLLLAHITLF